MSLLWTAAITGLVGNLHCAAMCGPLAVAGCRTRSNAIGYFAGRTVAYAFAGALCGALGSRIARATAIEWLQTGVLIAVAVGAAARGVALWRRRRLVQIRRQANTQRSRWYAPLVAMLPRQGLALGLASGLLPCGMLIAAWLLAAATGSAAHGAATMAVFSLATAPALLGSMAARRLFARLPRRVFALAWFALAIWLIARPAIDAAAHANSSQEHHSCAGIASDSH